MSARPNDSAKKTASNGLNRQVDMYSLAAVQSPVYVNYCLAEAAIGTDADRND